MRSRLLITLLAAGLAASCSENKSPSAAASGKTRKLIPSNVGADAPVLASPTGQFGQQQQQANGTPGAPGVAATTPGPAEVNTSDMPDAPADAQWTLYCQTIAGSEHVERSKDVKAQLVRQTGLKDWYVIHAGDVSNLYYGFYRSIDASAGSEDRKDGARAQRDKSRIDQMKDGAGNRPFSRCVFVELAAPDPVAEPEWNLANAPQEAFWSVQIGAYEHHADRKKFAIDAVREARARGVQAYYFHGPTVSSVCVGAWPVDAVKFNSGSRGMSTDPTQDLLVLPPGLPPVKDVITNSEGKRMLPMTSEVEIVDPTLIATMRQYPEHSVNGVVRVQKGKTIERRDPSFLVRVPGRFIEGENVGDRVQAGGADTSAADGFSFLRPQNIRGGQNESLNYVPKSTPAQNRPGRGRLRSLD